MLMVWDGVGMFLAIAGIEPLSVFLDIECGVSTNRLGPVRSREASVTFFFGNVRAQESQRFDRDRDRGTGPRLKHGIVSLFDRRATLGSRAQLVNQFGI